MLFIGIFNRAVKKFHDLPKRAMPPLTGLRYA